MKTLLILRHAKAKRNGWDDRDRPLAKRGRHDAPLMGELIERLDLVPHLVVTSDAKRARQTARRVAEAAGYDDDIWLSEALYLSSPQTHIDILRRLPDEADIVMLVGHNPSLEDLVEALTGKLVDLLTSALAHVELAIESWVELDEGAGKLVAVHYPSKDDQ